MKKFLKKQLFLMDLIEFKKLIDNFEVKDSRHIILTLKLIRNCALIILVGLYIWFFQYCRYESIIIEWFKQNFGVPKGLFVGLALFSAISVILFFVFETIFCFIPKIISIFFIEKQHQSENGSLFDKH